MSMAMGRRTSVSSGRPAMLQRQPVQKLHDEERMTVLLPDLMDRTDIGMVQGGSSTGLAAKTFQCLWLLCHIVGQEFESNKATKVGVLGLINDPHTAAAQLLYDPVLRDGLADECGRANHWREWYDAIFGGSTAMPNGASRTLPWLASGSRLSGAAFFRRETKSL